MKLGNGGFVFGRGGGSAKLVEVVDVTARLALTASQVHIGDLVKEVGQLGTVIVAGAGTAAVNGTYTEDGTYNGKPTFCQISGSTAVPYIVFNESQWQIKDSRDNAALLYIDNDYEAVPSPADVSIWTASDGADPTPTVTQGLESIAAGGTYVVLDVAELDSEAGYVRIAGPASLYEGLTHFWKLDETSGARVDAIGSADLSVSSTVGNTTGVLGNAALFTNEGYLSATAPTMAGEEATLAFWLKTTAAYNPNNNNIIGKWQGENQILFAFGNDFGPAPDVLVFYISDNTNLETTGAVAVNDGEWHSYVGTFNAGVLKLYMDGVLQATTTATITELPSSSVSFTVGSNAAGSDILQGKIDLAAIANRAWTQADVTKFHNSGDGWQP